MKVLIVNKFLYLKGGAETYTFKLGKAFKEHGHEVEYFGTQMKKTLWETPWGATPGNLILAVLFLKIF